MKRGSDERLAQLENIANDFVHLTRAELIQEFKDKKNREWNLDYWIRLARRKDIEVGELDTAAPVEMDQVVKG